MRHLLGYDATGEITGIHSHRQAATGLRGWPQSFELDNPDTVDPDSRAWLDSFKKKPTGGFVFYDCECPGTEAACKCAVTCVKDNHVKNGEIVSAERQLMIVQIAGESIAGESILDHPPGTALKLELTCDGCESVIVQQSARPQVLESTESELTIQLVAGKTEIVAYAPALGLVGTLRITGVGFHPFRLAIRGWGS